MPKLYQLPDGSWVAPDRVSSIEIRQPSEPLDKSAVVVRTKDGGEIVISQGDWFSARTLRDDLADAIVELLEEGEEGPE